MKIANRGKFEFSARKPEGRSRVPLRIVYASPNVGGVQGRLDRKARELLSAQRQQFTAACRGEVVDHVNPHAQSQLNWNQMPILGTSLMS